MARQYSHLLGAICASVALVLAVSSRAIATTPAFGTLVRQIRGGDVCFYAAGIGATRSNGSLPVTHGWMSRSACSWDPMTQVWVNRGEMLGWDKEVEARLSTNPHDCLAYRTLFDRDAEHTFEP